MTMNEDVAKEIVEEPKAVTPPETTNRDDAAFGGFAMCPRCGFDTRNRITPVNEEDKKEYIRNLLGGVSFSKEFTLFDGMFKIKFTEITTDESDKLIALLQPLLKDQMFMIKATQIKLLFTTVGYKKGDVGTEVDRDELLKLETPEAALGLFKMYFGKFPDTVNGSITSLFNVFSNQVVMIANESLDRNF
jgi:hypothetical protein